MSDEDASMRLDVETPRFVWWISKEDSSSDLYTKELERPKFVMLAKMYCEIEVYGQERQQVKKRNDDRDNGKESKKKECNRKCWNCGKHGHLSKNCWEKAENAHLRPRNYREI